MKISIIPQDNRIVVDGKTVDLDDNDIRWEFEDEHIHAIQWKDSMGEVEYEDEIGKDPLPNKSFGQDEFDTIVQPYLSFFEKFYTIFLFPFFNNYKLQTTARAHDMDSFFNPHDRLIQY